MVSIKAGKSGGKRHVGDMSSSSSNDIAAAGGQEEQYVNSDEELENVLDAMRYSRPTPLAQKSFYFVKRRRQCYRLHDILLDTITPKNNSQLDQLHHSNTNMFHPRHHHPQQTTLRSVNTSAVSASSTGGVRAAGQQNELALPTLIRIPGLAAGGAMRASGGAMNGGVLRDTR